MQGLYLNTHESACFIVRHFSVKATCAADCIQLAVTLAFQQLPDGDTLLSKHGAARRRK
jgi:hypothetical protein